MKASCIEPTEMAAKPGATRFSLAANWMMAGELQRRDDRIFECDRCDRR